MKYLSAHPDIAHGHLVIKGTRIRVAHVLKLVLEGLNPKDIHNEWYPQVSAATIHSAAEEAIQHLNTEAHA